MARGRGEDTNSPYKFTSLSCFVHLLRTPSLSSRHATSRQRAKKRPRRSTPRLVRDLPGDVPPQPRPGALPASPGGTTWPVRARRRRRPRSARGPGGEGAAGPPGRGRARPPPLPRDTHPAPPQARRGTAAGSEKGRERGRES